MSRPSLGKRDGMTIPRPRVLFVANRGAYERMLRPVDVDRLKEFVDFDWLECDVPFDRTDWTTVPDDPAATKLVASRMSDVDGLIVCHGSPRIGDFILGKAPNLK